MAQLKPYGLLTEEIQVFWLIAELGSYKAVGDLLFIAPATVRTHIKRLESSFAPKTKLFQQHQPFHKALLTAEGEALKKRLHDLFSLDTDITRHIQDITQGARGHVSIAAFPSATLLFIPSLLRPISSTMPMIDVNAYERGTSTILALVAKEEIDLGIVRLSQEMKSSDIFVITDLYEEEAIVVVSKEHAFAAQQKPIPLAALAKEPLLLLSETQGTLRQQLSAKFEMAHLQPRIVCEGPEIPTLLRMVAQNIGITIIPKYSWRVYPHLHEYLAYTSLVDNPITLNTGIIKKRGRYQTQAMQFAETNIIETRDRLMTIMRDDTIIVPNTII